MLVLAAVRKSRPLQFIILILLFVGAYYVIIPSKDSYSPEELNSILQNKESEILSLKKTELVEQSLKTPFLDQSSYKVKNWDVKGKTIVKNNEYIRLTQDLQHQAGNMFANEPISAESFEMELTFHIHGKTNRGMSGDGLAIWFIDEKSEIGDVFGIKNYFTGLGIMLDTYKNGKRGHFPFVNLMLGDGRTRYAKESDGFESRLAGCYAKDLVNPLSKETKMRLVYIKDGYLSVDFNYNGKLEDWTNCVTLTNVVLPQVKYYGLSAETGALSADVDIIESKIYSLFQPDGSPVESISQLKNLIQQEIDSPPEEVIQEPEDSTDTRHGLRARAFKKKSAKVQRKTLNRLKNAEKRIKEKERELRLKNYGDADANILKRTAIRVWGTIKYLVYAVGAILFVWVSFIVFRVLRQKKRPRTSGLLD